MCSSPLTEQVSRSFTNIREGPIVKAMVVPKAHGLSRSEVDKLEGLVKELGGFGLGRAKVGEDGASWTQSPLRSTSRLRAKAIHEATGATPGDLILFQMGKPKLVNTVFNGLRLHLGQKFDLIPQEGTECLESLMDNRLPSFRA